MKYSTLAIITLAVMLAASVLGNYVLLTEGSCTVPTYETGMAHKSPSKDRVSAQVAGL